MDQSSFHSPPHSSVLLGSASGEDYVHLCSMPLIHATKSHLVSRPCRLWHNAQQARVASCCISSLARDAWRGPAPPAAAAPSARMAAAAGLPPRIGQEPPCPPAPPVCRLAAEPGSPLPGLIGWVEPDARLSESPVAPCALQSSSVWRWKRLPIDPAGLSAASGRVRIGSSLSVGGADKRQLPRLGDPRQAGRLPRIIGLAACLAGGRQDGSGAPRVPSAERDADLIFLRQLV
jgi:hypothetical protein